MNREGKWGDQPPSFTLEAYKSPLWILAANLGPI